VPGNASSIFDWGADRPTPVVYYNDKVDANIAKWRWIDDKHGRIDYILPKPLNTGSEIRVDLGQDQFQGKPIWHRNCTQGFTLK
jgi:hypothetical protein